MEGPHRGVETASVDVDVPVAQLRRTASDAAITAVSPLTLGRASGDNDKAANPAGTAQSDPELSDAASVMSGASVPADVGDHSQLGGHARAGRAPTLNTQHIRVIGDRHIQLWYWEDVQLFDRVVRFRRQQNPSSEVEVELSNIMLLRVDTRSTRSALRTSMSERSAAERTIDDNDLLDDDSDDGQKKAEDLEEAMEQFSGQPHGDAIVKLVYGIPRYDFILKFPSEGLSEEQSKMLKTFEEALLQRGLFLEHELWPEEKAVYVRCLASFAALAHEAERNRLRFPLSTDMAAPATSDKGPLSFVRRLWWAMFSHNLREHDSDVFRVERLHDFLAVHAPHGTTMRRHHHRRFSWEGPRHHADDQCERIPSPRGGECDPMIREPGKKRPVVSASSSESEEEDDDDEEHTGVLGVDDMGTPGASQSATDTVNKYLKLRNHGQVPIWLLKERLMLSGLRSLLVHSIITNISTHFQGRRLAMRDMQANSIYTAMFPPHDGGLTKRAKADSRTPSPMTTPAASQLALNAPRAATDGSQVATLQEAAAVASEDDPASITNLRAHLYKSWSRASIFASQPIELVRAYFGEKIALYFVWVGFYTVWLTLPAIIGTVVFIFGIVDYVSGHSLQDIDIKELRGLVDNELTVPWALVVSLWATVFLEFWKRKYACVAYEWKMSDYEREENTRPKFRPTAIRTSPVTGKLELIIPTWERRLRWTVVTSTVLFWIALVIYSVEGRRNVTSSLRSVMKDRAHPLVPSVISAILNLVIIIILSELYNIVCKRLNAFENHRTFTQYNDSRIVKRYIFDFFNFYSILFFYGIFNVFMSKRCDTSNPTDECGPLPLTDLMIQLVIIFVGRQAIGQIQELAIPFLRRQWTERRQLAERLIARQNGERKQPSKPRYIKDEKLPEYGADEYNEMVVQFGFLSFFAIAFPPAYLCALINNAVEVRTDAFKLLTVYRRPVAFRTQDIGVWANIMTVIAMMAAPVNALIVALSSQWVHLNIIVPTAQRWFGTDGISPHVTEVGSNAGVWAARLAFILIFEHTVLLVKLLIIWLVPGTPDAVKIARAREQYRRTVRMDPQQAAQDVSMEDLAEVHRLMRQRRQKRIMRLPCCGSHA